MRKLLLKSVSRRLTGGLVGVRNRIVESRLLRHFAADVLDRVEQGEVPKRNDDGEFSDAFHGESPLAIGFLGRAMARARSFQYREYDELKEAANSDDVEQSNHFFFSLGSFQYFERQVVRAHRFGGLL